MFILQNVYTANTVTLANSLQPIDKLTIMN